MISKINQILSNIEIPKHPNIQIRLVVLTIELLLLFIVTYSMTGEVIPTQSQAVSSFQSLVLLVILGSLIVEDKFTKPLDAFVNSVTGVIALIPLWNIGLSNYAFLYCLIIFIISLTSIVLNTRDEDISQTRKSITQISYRVSVIFGRSHVIFSLLFLNSILSLSQNVDKSLPFIMLWGFYLSIFPLKLPHIVQAFSSIFFQRSYPTILLGEIVRIDAPNIVRYKLTNPTGSIAETTIGCLGDGTLRYLQTLFHEVQDNKVIVTSLALHGADQIIDSPISGFIYSQDDELVDMRKPIGFVRENSRISTIRFETWEHEQLFEGLLVYCLIKNQKVYYQVTEGLTEEETLQQHWHGFQTVQANQLGILDNPKGFRKFSWTPTMNTPIFVEHKHDLPMKIIASDFSLGKIPNTNIDVICTIDDIISHHTAILGVTGTGKTELAFSIIRKAVDSKVKVMCVDITGDYFPRLSRAKDINPVELSITADLSDKLAQQLFAVETGQYGAGKEKEALKQYTTQLTSQINGEVKKFLDGEHYVGVFTMPTIANTKATIYATELYISSIFRYARNPGYHDKIMIVLEEAHTVIPEANTMGVDGYDAKAVIAKIAQVALQGRKYNVGLLVIAQRTATVSKTVLTQCNTIISFTSYDKTSEDFLSHYFGGYSAKISNLPFLHAIAFGKGIKSERPIIIEIPYNKDLETANGESSE